MASLSSSADDPRKLFSVPGEAYFEGRPKRSGPRLAESSEPPSSAHLVTADPF